MIDKLREIIRENKSKTIIIIVLVVFVLIMIIFSSNNVKNKNYKSQKYVYTSETNEIGEFTSKIPYINIHSDDIDNVNEEIMTKYYTEVNVGEKYADYEYYQNKNIVSLLVKYQYLEGDTETSLDIDFYNIDIDTGNLITDDELLNRYNVDNSYVEKIIIDDVKKYHSYEIEKDYISDCDFNCYKERLDNNKKTTDKDNYYFNLAENYLYQEFSIALNLSYDETKQYVIDKVAKLSK